MDFLGGCTVIYCTEIEEQGTVKETGRTVQILAVHTVVYCCTEIEVFCCVIFLSFGTIPKATVHAFISQKIVAAVWHSFRGDRTVKEGSENEELTYAFVQEILLSISRSLALHFLRQSLARFSR